VPDDLVAIEALLSAVGLPTVGVAEGLAHFKVAVQDGIVGVIGAEYGDDAVLLRSFAVAEALRNTGIAGTLLTTALAEAKERGSKAVYLLTTTAVDYFSKRNFRRINRSDIPEILLAKSALDGVCPATSVCMTLAL
jgi:amino-acid N-acetyltransferase